MAAITRLHMTTTDWNHAGLCLAVPIMEPSHFEKDIRTFQACDDLTNPGRRKPFTHMVKMHSESWISLHFPSLKVTWVIQSLNVQLHTVNVLGLNGSSHIWGCK